MKPLDTIIEICTCINFSLIYALVEKVLLIHDLKKCVFYMIYELTLPLYVSFNLPTQRFHGTMSFTNTLLIDIMGI